MRILLPNGRLLPDVRLADVTIALGSDRLEVSGMWSVPRSPNRHMPLLPANTGCCAISDPIYVDRFVAG